MEQIKNQIQNKTTRKKIILWGLSILASVSALKYLSPKKKKAKSTVKMLTQDGKLVEIEKSVLGMHGKKITDTELQNWITKTPIKN